jgi:hypothetical protein
VKHLHLDVKTANLANRLLSTLLIACTSHLVLAEPTYPDNFTSQIIYQDKQYITEHNQFVQSEMLSLTRTTGTVTRSSSTMQLDSKYPSDFEPVILYEDKDYFSNHSNIERH